NGCIKGSVDHKYNGACESCNKTRLVTAILFQGGKEQWYACSCGIKEGEPHNGVFIVHFVRVVCKGKENIGKIVQKCPQLARMGWHGQTDMHGDMPSMYAKQMKWDKRSYCKIVVLKTGIAPTEVDLRRWLGMIIWRALERAF
ncbi:hypothetical protein ADUPG1_007888, partial [Aduncisulcus paluster]